MERDYHVSVACAYNLHARAASYVIMRTYAIVIKTVWAWHTTTPPLNLEHKTGHPTSQAGTNTSVQWWDRSPVFASTYMHRGGEPRRAAYGSSAITEPAPPVLHAIPGTASTGGVEVSPMMSSRVL